MVSMGFWAQTRLLLWKNWLLKKRHPLSTLSELLLPLAFVALVCALQTLDPDEKCEAAYYTCPGTWSVTPTLFLKQKEGEDFFKEFEVQGYANGMVTVAPFVYLMALLPRIERIVAIAPANAGDAAAKAWIEEFIDTMDSWTGALDPALAEVYPFGTPWTAFSSLLRNTTSSLPQGALEINFCSFRSLTKVYASASELNDYITGSTYSGDATVEWPRRTITPRGGLPNFTTNCPIDDEGRSTPDSLKNPQVHFSLLVDNVAKDSDGEFAYTLRFNQSVIPFTYPNQGFTDNLDQGVNYQYLNQYAQSGFLTAQLTVDRFIVNRTSVGPGPARESETLQRLGIAQFCEALSIDQFIGNDGPVEDTPCNCECTLERLFLRPTIVLDGLELPNPYYERRAEWLEPLSMPSSLLPNDVRMAAFPTPEYVSRPFYQKIQDVFALILILTFLWPTSRLVRGIVQEKEQKIREGMRMMGLSSAPLYAAWFFTYGACLPRLLRPEAVCNANLDGWVGFSSSSLTNLRVRFRLTGMIFLLVAVLITAFASINLFATTSPGIVFAYFFLFGLDIIAYCFLISVLFNRAKTASTAGVTLFFMAFFAYFAVDSSNATAGSKALGCLLAPTAFGIGASLIASFEAGGQGLDWSSATIAPNANQIPFALVLFFLVFDLILYLFLAWYLDNVVQQEFGVARPWYFLCTPSYWCSGAAYRRKTRHGSINAQEMHRGEEDAMLGSPAHRCDLVESASPELQRLADEGRVVRLEGLRKEFSTPVGTKVAVQHLDLTMYEGQIFVLLGHNGAGKTTTISMLTGLIPPSSGRATVPSTRNDENGRAFSLDVSRDMDEIRRSLGVCPQHDVLWSDLTVAEHLEFFARLKGVEDVEGTVSSKIAEIGLTEKRDVLSQNLSGGQKRKLSVAIAFLGDSKVVFLDEPTSGMDPYSRRSTWNMLQNNTAGRVVVLTTHFMDEADILGDRIAIMGEGELRCCGSSLFLKSKYGVGYTLTLVKKQGNGLICNSVHVVSLVQKYAPEAKILSDVGAELALQVPLDCAPSFPDMFSELDSQMESLSLEAYGISVTTLEEVFMKVASDDGDPSEHQKTKRKSIHMRKSRDCSGSSDVEAGFPASSPTLGSANRHGDSAEPGKPTKETGGLSLRASSDDPTLLGGTHSSLPQNPTHAEVAPIAALEEPLLAEPAFASEEALAWDSSGRDFGANVFWPHFRALYLKRFHYAKRDKRSLCCNTLLPVVLLVLGLALLKAFPLEDPPPFVLSVDSYEQSKNYVPFNTSATDATTLATADGLFLPTSTGGYGQPATIPNVSSLPAIEVCQEPYPYDYLSVGGLSQWLLESQSDRDATLPASYSGETLYGAVQLDEVVSKEEIGSQNSSLLRVTILQNTSSFHAPGIYMAVLNQAVLSWYGEKETSDATVIKTTNQPLPITARTRALVDNFTAVSAAIIIMIAFSFIPASVAVFVVKEREISAKHQQFVSGASIGAYWTSAYAWDLCSFLLPWALSVLFVKVFDIESFQGRNLIAVATLFGAYGIAVLPFTYVLSYLFQSHSTAQNVVLLINFLTGLVLMIASFVMSLIDSTVDINKSLEYVYRLFPGFCLGNGLLNLTIQNAMAQLSISVDGVSQSDAFDLDVVGADLIYLCSEAVVYFVLTITIDVLLSYPSIRANLTRFRAGKTIADEPYEVDEDVARETVRVERMYERGDETSGGDGDDVIILNHMRKEYGGSKVAVKDISFAISRGECFGFLGINGAGKTSTLKMITGDVLPTKGSATLAGYDILSQQREVRSLIGQWQNKPVAVWLIAVCFDCKVKCQSVSRGTVLRRRAGAICKTTVDCFALLFIFAGYCPQFDALLENLTCREHLELYARLKQVPPNSLNAVVAEKLHEMNLDDFEHKLAGSLSGGNKRKLSVAIAMIGRPPIVFLDEPSTGMDPVNRRFMWDVISNIATKQKQSTIILTTHSMEECEALCTRVGIMVGGRLRCFGAIQHLKSRYGNGLTIQVKMEGTKRRDILRVRRRLGADPSLPNLPEIPVRRVEAASSVSVTLSRSSPLGLGCVPSPGGDFTCEVGDLPRASETTAPIIERRNVPGQAEHAGVRVGMVVVAVDSVSTSGLTFERVLGLINASTGNDTISLELAFPLLDDDTSEGCATLTFDDVTAVCRSLGNEGRLSMLNSNDPSGWIVHAALVRDGSVRVTSFAEWWCMENDVERLTTFMMDTFKDAKLIERRGEYTRWQVPLDASRSLGEVFGDVERSKTGVGVAEYSVSQTSLEQIFNSFAAQQEEEQGEVRGMQLAVMAEPVGTVTEARSAEINPAETA